MANKSLDKPSGVSQVLSEADREFVEQMDQEYFTRVKSSDSFYRRKNLILQNLQRLEKKVEPLARSFDDFQKLKFIVLEKARQKKQIVKSFQSIRNESADSAGQEPGGDDFDLLYGLENE